MTEPTTPSRRAGLRAEIAAALEAADYRMDMRRGDLADAVLPVLYREWPWLRAEAEAAVPVSSPPPDQTALRDRIAEAVQDGPTWMLPRSLSEEVADAVLAVLPPPADRAAVLREAAAICDEAASVYAARGADDANSGANTAAGALFALMERFQRKADDAEYVATPCAPMVPCEDGGEPCHVHERLMAHAEGDHELCEPDCGVSVAAEAQQQPDTETPTCPDPIECAHEAALGQAQQQVKRVRDVCDQLRRASVLADGEPHTDRERGIVQAVTRVMAALDKPAAGSGRVAAEARPETVCSESVAHIADAVERSAAADTGEETPS